MSSKNQKSQWTYVWLSLIGIVILAVVINMTLPDEGLTADVLNVGGGVNAITVTVPGGALAKDKKPMVFWQDELLVVDFTTADNDHIRLVYKNGILTDPQTPNQEGKWIPLTDVQEVHFMNGKTVLDTEPVSNSKTRRAHRTAGLYF